MAPLPAVRTSYLRAHAEIAAEPGLDRADADGWMQLSHGAPPGDAAVLADPAGFDRFCASLRRLRDEDAPRPQGWVPETTLWWVDGPTWIGRLSIRHRLTPFLLDVGGHVGYVVRPSEREHGHATAMLRAALPVAAGLGIDRVLVTCDHDNHASRRVIEKAGGEREDRRGVKLRYWVATAPR